jgi:hypothetical protein
MFLKRIFKGMPDLGPWVAVAELFAALATVIGTLMALNVVPSPFGGAPAGKVSGTVTDARTGKPVPEATVQIADTTSAVIAAEAVPGADGRWKANEPVKPGNYTVKAICDGYAPAAKTVSIVASKERIVNLSIRPQTKAEEQARAAGGAAPQPAAAAPKIVVIAPGAGGGGASASAAPSDDQKAKAEFEKAKKYQGAGKTGKAREALVAAVQLDPGEGRYWAAYVNLEYAESNTAQAQDLARDGLKQVTKNKALLQAAAENVGVTAQ